MKEEQGANLVSLGKALDMGYPIILRLPEDMPILTSVFNDKDLTNAPLMSINDRNKGGNKKAQWAIVQTESWPEFERVLNDITSHKTYPQGKLSIGFNKYFRAFSQLTIPSDQQQAQEEKATRLIQNLQEQGRGRVGSGEALHADENEITAFPHFFNANAGLRKNRALRLRVVVPRLNRQTGRLDFVGEGRAVDQQSLDF